MPRFSANISMLFTEHDWLDRPKAAADAGFGAIEIQFPYEHSVEAWAKAIGDAGVAVAVLNLPVGDMLSGGPGLAAIPGREDAFAEAITQAKAYAAVLRPRNVNVLAGMPPANLPRMECLDILAGNLRAAAEAFEPLGVGVVTEAVNTRDRPGYFLSRTEEAVAAVRLAGHGNLGIQHDLYHMQIMEGDLVETLSSQRAVISHIQFADAPGRHEPGTGEIPFPIIFEAIDAIGYGGWVGAEYEPTGRTEDSLEWLRPWI
jgi:hydroxypyruvate isomerase